MEGEAGVQLTTSKAEIDTSAPFRSVKEAVVLFGERVLATQVYGGINLKEMQDRTKASDDHDELEETKQCLQKAVENSVQMATSLFSLQQELHETKMELRQLKIHESDLERQRAWDLDTEEEEEEEEEEDIKFVEEYLTTTEEVVNTTTTINSRRDTETMVFHKKKCVRFANPPNMAQVIIPPLINPTTNYAEAVLQRPPSLEKKKIKQIIPFIKRLLFSKKA